MIINQTDLFGCFEMLPDVRTDGRGSFVKTFHLGAYEEMNLNTTWAEEYYSVSRRRVLRGLHFQIPPYDHIKIVYCVVGNVFDVILDMRLGSPTFGKHQMFDVNAKKANMLYIPSGIAHGFVTLSESATMIYKVTTVYAPEHDTGILWSSAGIEWPEFDPIVSRRDAALPSLSDFESPFVFDGT